MSVTGTTLRPGRREDLPAIVRLLADDALGRARERHDDPLPDCYKEAFARMAGDPKNLLLVAENDAGAVVGCLQITFISGLSYQGAERALIEDVRVDPSHRNRGIGRHMLEWAIAEARRRKCRHVQLLVHQSRDDARKLYKALGFQDNHLGMRLPLDL